MTEKKSWGGRFSESTHALVEAFTASIEVDRRLYRHDIRGSIAHARMLAEISVLTAGELRSIEGGLETIRAQIERGEFEWSESREDIHINIEAKLVELIGDAGKKLHTARSRNDQVATDLRLYLREQLDELCRRLGVLQRALVEMAAAEAATIMPGLTHTQSAQPVTFGHHLLAWNEMLQRDYERLRECRGRINISPLGSAALAGTGFDINRKMTAEALGFEQVSNNSLDAVSDRDFAIEFNAQRGVVDGALIANGRRNGVVVVGRFRFHRPRRRLLHRLQHHAAKEKSGCGRVGARQVRPRERQPDGVVDAHESAAAGV